VKVSDAIAGMDRLMQRNVLAMSGRAVEAAGDVSTLLLDKTGTITYGYRQASELAAVAGMDERALAAAALASSLADETPEGRSIVTLATERYGLVADPLPGAQLVRRPATRRDNRQPPTVRRRRRRRLCDRPVPGPPGRHPTYRPVSPGDEAPQRLGETVQSEGTAGFE
jgi:hypothetical protein